MESDKGLISFKVLFLASLSIKVREAGARMGFVSGFFSPSFLDNPHIVLVYVIMLIICQGLKKITRKSRRFLIKYLMKSAMITRDVQHVYIYNVGETRLKHLNSMLYVHGQCIGGVSN